MLCKDGMVIEGDFPEPTKNVGKRTERTLYGSMQDKIDTYLQTLSGNETQQEVIDGTKRILATWQINNLPLAQASLNDLFKRGIASGMISVGQRFDSGDRMILDLLAESDYRIGERIKLFAKDVADQYTIVIRDSFGPNQEFNLAKLIGDMNHESAAQRYKLERLARTEVGQTSGLGKFWGWEKRHQDGDDKHDYGYFWHGVNDSRQRETHQIREQGNPYSYEEASFLWTHNHMLNPRTGKWEMGAINERCTVSRSPSDAPVIGNRFLGQEYRFQPTLDVQLDFME